jgi:hypothetical protein
VSPSEKIASFKDFVWPETKKSGAMHMALNNSWSDNKTFA